jgi:hypothetical protein
MKSALITLAQALVLAVLSAAGGCSSGGVPTTQPTAADYPPGVVCTDEGCFIPGPNGEMGPWEPTDANSSPMPASKDQK